MVKTSILINRFRIALIAFFLSLAGAGWVWAHSVGQVQTTKFLAPETVTILTDRIAAGQPAGFQVGDVISYIIQFTPIANGNANVGVAGYITDYLPPGVEVVGAAIVSKDSSGNYFNVAPNFPGGIDDGWGDRGANTFLAPFATSAYDPTGRCLATGKTNSCNGRLTELHADTGIFYSTDPRTAVFPALPTRILQSANGYNINPTAAGQLNPIIGQTVATTHNLWDADQTNAFGSTSAAVGALPTPKSAAPSLSVGLGPAPYYAGSAVAGPNTGYPLDNTAQVGPWKRIAYSGSRIGDATTGPALVAGLSTTAVGGLPTALGHNLSPSNPLPAGTNAVRWAVGKLVVGTISYVKISVRVTQPVPAQGLINSSEVFGGDAGDGPSGGAANDGKDNPWRYHVPSVADNNSNLFIQKIPCVYDPLAASCTPLTGSYYPAGPTTITYQITYLNSGTQDQTNVVISDNLPCQTPAGALVRVGAATGPMSTVLSVPFTTTTASAGNCTTSPQTRYTVTFPTITTLPAGSGGRLVINVPNSATTLNDDVLNTAKIVSSQTTAGAQSTAVTFVGDATTPILQIGKSTTTPSTVAGGTTQYQIVIRNTGTGPATLVTISDILPSMGGTVADPTTRFNFVSPTVSITSTSFTTTPPVVVSTSTAALSALTPYNTQPGATNTVLVNWAFGTGSSLAAGGVITITFNASIGSNVAASSTPYGNNVVAQYTGGSGRTDVVNAAGVSVTSALTVNKTMQCYYVGATCVPVSGAGTIPTNAKVRYIVDYANTGSAVSNVTVSDTLPCQLTAATGSPTVTISALSGPIAAVASPVAVGNGVCSTTFRTVILGTITSLASGATGSFAVEMQLVTPSTVTSVVTNQATIFGTSVPGGSSQVQNTVLNLPNLVMNKTSSPVSVKPGDTVSYVLTITNTGTAPATTLTVFDWLPTGTSTVADITRRFSYVTATTVVSGSLTNVVPNLNQPPTQSPYTAAAGNTFAANQQELVWNFGAQSLAVGASTTIAFTAVVGTALLPLPPPNYYYNNAKVAYGTNLQTSSNAAATSIINQVNLSISKTNNTTTVAAGSSTTYTVVISNGNLLAANGAVVKESPNLAGLRCTQVTCTATTNGATCPVSLPLGTPVASSGTTLFGVGEAIPVFPANSTVTLLVSCGVIATGQ